MDRKLLDYLPPVLREVADFVAINEANEPEIALAWDALSQVLANQFLETADVRGVSVWEKELKIFPKDTDSMELRKARIKAMWNRETPYTIPWLKSWLTEVFGADRHEERVEDYALIIQLKQDLSKEMSDKTSELFEMLPELIPANIWVMLENVFPTLFVHVPLRARLGTRLSEITLPPRVREPRPAGVCPAARLGWRMSITTLPMRAEGE